MHWSSRTPHIGVMVDNYCAHRASYHRAEPLAVKLHGCCASLMGVVFNPCAGGKRGGIRRGPAGWSDLPPSVAEDIVEMAFLANGGDVAAWVQMYLVCKCAASVSWRCCG